VASLGHVAVGIGTRFISVRGLGVAMTELVYFAPLLLWAIWPGRLKPHDAEQAPHEPPPTSRRDR
jgi:hypothetical protein